MSFEKWLEELNEQYSRERVPIAQRPGKALGEWSKKTGGIVRLDDPVAQKILEWFQKNSKPGTFCIGVVFKGAAFFDESMWAIHVPHIFGTVRIGLRDVLKMPEPVYSRLIKDRAALKEVCDIWLDCMDYALGIEEVAGHIGSNVLCSNMLRSGNDQLREAVELLLADKPNVRAMESSRFATEMFLKAFLAWKTGLREKGARKLSHNVEKILQKCLQADPNS